MKKIWIVGLGPGHEDYILPIAQKKIESADYVIGGKRHLEFVDDQKSIGLKIPLEGNLEFIRDKMKTEQVAILVSGDTGFYSMLRFIKRHFNDDEIQTYPGISSLQYLFSAINKSYEQALLTSVHGRSFDFDLMAQYQIVGLLTDKVMTPEVILKACHERDLKGKMYIGENLSYPDEVITVVDISSRLNKTFSSLCVVVIEFE